MFKRLLAFELLDALDAYELGNATLWALSNAFDESSGKLRDEDLLFAPSYASLRAKYALAQVLRVARAFA